MAIAPATQIHFQKYRRIESSDYTAASVGCELQHLDRNVFIQCAALCIYSGCIMFGVNGMGCAVCLQAIDGSRVAPYLDPPPSINTYHKGK